MTKLRQARQKAGLRRDYVACKLGITGDHLNLLERGKSKLDLLKIEKLAEIYGTSVADMTEIAIETLKEG
jgi:transcriptional regulator with XRE-family HTH domain